MPIVIHVRDLLELLEEQILKQCFNVPYFKSSSKHDITKKRYQKNIQDDRARIPNSPTEFISVAS